MRIVSRAQLDDYMEGSAATVGRVIAPLLGAPEPEAVARLGVAFQLTNFIRDVPIDWDLDRVYLPGLPGGRPARGRRQRVAARADRPGGRARPRPVRRDRRRGPRAGARDAQRGVRMARAVYAQVLDRVEGNGYDVLGARARLRPWEAARAAVGR